METHLPQSPRFALVLTLGLLAGFVSGWNLTLVAVLLLVVVLDVPMRSFLSIWAAGFLLAWVCIPVSFQMGRLILDHTPWGGFVAALGDGTIVALLDWDRYVLVGGLMNALLISMPLTWAVKQVLDRWQSRPLLDDQPGPVCQIPSFSWKPRCRRHALRYATIGIGCLAAVWLIAPRFAARHLLQELTIANGADVQAGSVQFSLISGNLTLEQLEVDDPQHPGQKCATAARVSARMIPGAWLRGRYCLDDVRVQGLALNTQSARIASAPAERPISLAAVEQHQDPPASPANRVTELPLEVALRTWERWRPQFAGLQLIFQRLDALNQCQAMCQTIDKPGWIFADRGLLTSLRSDLGSAQPRVAIRSLQADNLMASCGLGEKAMIELSNFTTLAQANDEPARLTVVAPELGFDLTARLSFAGGSGKHDVRFRAFDVPMSALPHYGSGGGLFVDRGKLSVTGQGWATASSFDAAVSFRAEEFGVYVAGSNLVVGLTPVLWTAGLSCLDEFRGNAALRGSWNAPMLVLEHEQLIGSFEQQLRAAGAVDYVRAIAEQTAPGYQPPLIVAQTATPHDGNHAQATDRPEERSAPELAAAQPAGTSQASLETSGQAAVPETTMPHTADTAVANASPINYPDTGYPATEEAYCRVPAPQVTETPGPINLTIGYDAEFLQAQLNRPAATPAAVADAIPTSAATSDRSAVASAASSEAFNPTPQFQPWPKANDSGAGPWPRAEAALAFDSPPAVDTTAEEPQPSAISRWYQGITSRFRRPAEPVEEQASEARTADVRVAPASAPEEPRQATRSWGFFRK